MTIQEHLPGVLRTWKVKKFRMTIDHLGGGFTCPERTCGERSRTICAQNGQVDMSLPRFVHLRRFIMVAK